MRCGTPGCRPATLRHAPRSRQSWPHRNTTSKSWWLPLSKRSFEKHEGGCRETAALFFSAGRCRLRGLGCVPLRLDLAREQPTEIGQRRVRADGEQLIVRIGIEHLLLRLDDVLVLVEAFFQRVPQRERYIRIVDVKIVQIIPEEMRGGACLRRHELR